MAKKKINLERLADWMTSYENMPWLPSIGPRRLTRAWLLKQLERVDRAARRDAQREAAEMRAVLEKIAGRRPCVDRAWRSFYRCRQDAQDVLYRLANAEADPDA
jgi:hypothetical protein